MRAISDADSFPSGQYLMKDILVRSDADRRLYTRPWAISHAPL